MVVQFNCLGCRQPIEVDDEWAGRQVACPFCQRVVTPPAASTLSPQQTAAAPVARETDQPITPTGVEGPSGVNRLAVAGLSCSLAAIFLLLLFQILTVFLLREADPRAPFQEQYQQMLNRVEEEGVMDRLVLSMGCICLSFACWLTGLVLSIIAVTRSHPRGRGMAIAGIVCCMPVFPLVLCSNLPYALSL